MTVRTHHFPAPTNASVEVRNPSGSVTVEAVDGSTEYDVRVEALTTAAEELLDQVEITDAGGRLRVITPERRLLRTPSFAIAVRVPAGADVRVAVASADVQLRGPLGRGELTSASGDVAVEHGTELQVRTASGDVRIGTASGRVTVGTASGDLRVEQADGGLVVHTASGDVEAGRADGTVEVKTASGDVRFGAVGSGRLQLKTVSGDAEIGVVPGLRVWLDLSSVSGRMESRLDDDAATGDGPAQLTLSMRSVSGDLRIHRATAVG